MKNQEKIIELVKELKTEICAFMNPHQKIIIDTDGVYVVEDVLFIPTKE